jgi:uncharacterized protein (DUF1330 family)
MMNRFQRVIDGLNRHGVSYVVVGGVATNLHGHARVTLDLDLIVDFDTGNLAKLRDVMNELSYAPRVPADPTGLADPETRKSWQARHMLVYSFVSLMNPPLIVDVFIEHPIPFGELIDRSSVTDFGGVPTRICSIDHLVTLKQMAGRPKDIEDIDALKLTRDERPHTPSS